MSQTQPVRMFGAKSGHALPFTELGIGTAPLGNMYRALTEASAQGALQAGWDAGCRYIETVPFYGLGLTETRINTFLRDRPRADYVLSTRVGRRLAVCPPEERAGIGQFFETPSRRVIFDYSHDGVRLIEAALRFLLAHPAVVSVIPGGHTADEVKGNAEVLRANIPPALWTDLKSQGLLRADAPVPN